jgi:hypothetical protein
MSWAFFALVIASVLIGFINGVFTGIFGWPTLASDMRDLLLLSLFIIALIIYRNHRKHRHSPKMLTPVEKQRTRIVPK